MDFTEAKAFAMSTWFSDEFSDAISYNGVGIRGHLVHGAGQVAVARYATLTVKVSDVPAPGYRDTVIYNSVTWRVFQIEDITGDGLTWDLPLIRDERPKI